MEKAAPSVVFLQNMALENAALEPHSTWFLHALGGNLLLRLRTTLHIGEDPSGDLVLAPVSSEALLTITLEQNGLQLKCSQSGWLLQEDVSEDPPAASHSLTLTPGDAVALSLPNNQFTLAGRSLHHTPITRHISLSVEPEIPTLYVEVLAEPPLMAMTTESLKESANPPAPELPLSADAFHEPILIQEAADLPGPAEDAAATASATKPNPVQATVYSTKRSFQPNRAALAVMIAGLVLAIYLTTDSQRSSLAGGTPSLTDEGAFPSEQTLQLLGSSSSTIAEALTVPTTTQPPKAAPIAAPSRSDLDWETRRMLNFQLAEAERLIAAGAIFDAGDSNAIKTLTAVLNTDPTNEQGLALIYQCAMLLLDQARAANAVGDEFLARNLTEEVLAFHPTLPEALALRSQLRAQ